MLPETWGTAAARLHLSTTAITTIMHARVIHTALLAAASMSAVAAHNYTFEHSAIAGGNDIQKGMHTVQEVVLVLLACGARETSWQPGSLLLLVLVGGEETTCLATCACCKC